MRKQSVMYACSAIVFFAGIGMLAAGIVVTMSPLVIAGVLGIFVGSMLGFASANESRYPRA